MKGRCLRETTRKAKIYPGSVSYEGGVREHTQRASKEKFYEQRTGVSLFVPNCQELLCPLVWLL